MIALPVHVIMPKVTSKAFFRKEYNLKNDRRGE